MVRLAVYVLLALLAVAAPAAAHPAPFTFLDIRVTGSDLELSLVAHVFDIAHEVGLERPEDLFQEAILNTRGPQFAALLPTRITFTVDAQAVATEAWTVVEPLPDRQSIRLASRVRLAGPPGVIRLNAYLFPYDTAHQTFVNFHENDRVASQTILDASRRDAPFYAGTARGSSAAAWMIAPRGVGHVLRGTEHLALLAGLLLIVSTRRQAAMFVLMFAAGQLVTTLLGGFAVILPPQRLIEPALALAIVYVGADNLMATGGRDVRPWMALAMGAIHGFSVGALLRQLSFSRPAMMAAALTVNLATAVPLLALALVLQVVVERLRAGATATPGRLLVPGSVLVILIGAAWFIQLVFFPTSPLPAFGSQL